MPCRPHPSHAIALALATAAHACPPFLYEEGHADIRPVFVGDRLALVLHVEDLPPFQGAEAVVRGSETPFAERPAGAEWEFLGVPAGAPLWMLPQHHEPGLPLLGFSGESIPSGALAGGVRIRLVDARGPGHFSLYTATGSGNVSVHFDTGDGLGEDDALTIPVGSHTHHWFAFTAQGAYELTLIAEGATPGGLPVEGDPAVFRFEIPPVCPADADLDGQADVADLLAFLTAFRAGDLRADANADCAVTVADLLAFLAAFSAGC